MSGTSTAETRRRDTYADKDVVDDDVGQGQLQGQEVSHCHEGWQGGATQRRGDELCLKPEDESLFTCGIHLKADLHVPTEFCVNYCAAVNLVRRSSTND